MIQFIVGMETTFNDKDPGPSRTAAKSIHLAQSLFLVCKRVGSYGCKKTPKAACELLENEIHSDRDIPQPLRKIWLHEPRIRFVYTNTKDNSSLQGIAQLQTPRA